jgi:hypothetical protein
MAMSSDSALPSRRSVLTGAGIAAAACVTLAGTPSAFADDRHAVANASPGAIAVEFRGRVSQTGATGETFTSLGFLTKVDGLDATDLFAGSTRGVGTALFTAVASGELVARVLDSLVHDLEIEGSLTVYQRSAPGASFDDPSSFAVGTPVATYDLVLQDVLAVIDTGKGVPTLVGDMTQTAATAVAGTSPRRNFGRRSERLRFFATGLGHLVDPVTLNAELEIAGNWSAV